MVQERRRTPRVQAYHPVRLHRPGNPLIVETLTKDLALGGLRCLSHTVFPVSSEFDLELTLGATEAPLPLKGKAMWFRTIPQSEQFDLGIAFIELSPNIQRRLSAYLLNRMPQAVPA